MNDLTNAELSEVNGGTWISVIVKLIRSVFRAFNTQPYPQLDGGDEDGGEEQGEWVDEEYEEDQGYDDGC
jgi:hypothetical protein